MTAPGLVVLSPREADVFACFADAVVAPTGSMLSISRSGAVERFDAWLVAASPLERTGLRGALWAIEIAPLLSGSGGRLRRLGVERRRAFIDGMRFAPLAVLIRLFCSAARLCYYSNDEIMRELGYDPETVLARGRKLRKREQRW